MEDLKQQCEKTFYKELYQLPDENQSLVLEESTQRVFLKKRLTVWSEEALLFLRDHKDLHVAGVQTFWKEDDGTLTVIEEYVQGETLEAALSAGPLTEERRRDILLSVLDGVSFLHSGAIIHRDIKPANIMLTADGAKLIDYDAAKVYHGGTGRDTRLLGTNGVAAPEQYGFAESDVRTDIYALGVLTRTLFPNDPQYGQVAEKATRMDPQDRYQTVAEMKNALLRIPPQRPKKRLPRAVILAGIAAVAVVIVVLLVRGVGGTSGVLDAELLDSGYGLVASSDSEYVQVCFGGEIHNPNSGYALKNVRLEAIARDESGAVLDSDYIRVRYIAAGDTVFVAYDGMMWKGEPAASVDLRLLNTSAEAVRQNVSGAVPTEALEVKNVTEQRYLQMDGEDVLEYNGEVTNTSDQDLEGIGVFVIYRKDGEMVGGRVGFAEDVKAGETVPFQAIPSAWYTDYDSYEIHALQWTY